MLHVRIYLKQFKVGKVCVEPKNSVRGVQAYFYFISQLHVQQLGGQ